jgi:restriction endonuclease S subunit
MAKLKTYGEIFSGYSFRNQLELSDNPEFGVIQLKDVSVLESQIDYLGLSTTSGFTGSNRYILQDRDILLIARGNSNGAVLFEKDKCDHPVLAAGAFIVLRPMVEFLDSAYLAWYLNLADSQTFLKRSRVGTTVQNLSIGALQEFDIKIPPLQKQQIIGRLYLLNQQDKRISRQREEKWTQLINEQIKGIL